MSSFQSLGLNEPIARALVEEKYENPTPIQSQTIPHVLAGRDVVGIAQTGTGKTAAFALPILNHLVKNQWRPQPRNCRVLVLSPTRELSAQIVDSFTTYGRHIRPRMALAIGGVPINRQIRSLTGGVDVLVATPGRLLDLMNSRAVHLDKVEVFVLDEADRMLDMGFIHDIKRVVSKLPQKRQTLFFSATMPKEITELANSMLNDPVRVAVTPQATTVERITQRVVFVDRGGKPALLVDTLRNETINRALIFTRTKRGADKVVRDLNKSGLAAEAIHGNKSQGQRERVLADFRAGKIRTLVATDIAARGIDVDGISHVINYDLPNIPESYVHRIGRTARAGADGVAISFCDGEEKAFLRDIERLIRISIPSSGQVGTHRSQPHAERAPQQHREHREHRANGSGNGHRRDHNGGGGGHHNGGQRKRSRGNSSQQGRPAQHQQHQERGGPRPIASTDSIGTVAFMQPTHQPRRQDGARRPAR